MKVEVKQITSWSLALDMARMTVNKEPLHKEPSNEWKRKMLKAEHSPIRCVQYLITLKDVPYYSVMHLVRHHQGIEKFVCTQREDRTGINRHSLAQDALISCSFICNAQALINISRVRLCGCADPTTRTIWANIKNYIHDNVDSIVSDFMVPNCVYRGFCPELKCCGWCNGSNYKQIISKYRNNETREHKEDS